MPIDDQVIPSKIAVMRKIISCSKILAAAGDYAAYDVLAEGVTVSTTSCWIFPGMARIPNGTGTIVKGQAIYGKAGGATNITPRISLILFSVIPTAELRDNVASTAVVFADIPFYVGAIDFPALMIRGTSGTACPESTTTPSTSGNVPLTFTCSAIDTNLYGIAVAIDAETNETAGATLRFNLEVEQN